MLRVRGRGLSLGDLDYEHAATPEETGVPMGFDDRPAMLLGVRPGARVGLLGIHRRVRKRPGHADLHGPGAA